MKARLPQQFQPKSQADLMRQAQEMQNNMQVLQQELDAKEYTASAGGEMVTATVTGKHNITSLKINKDLIEEAMSDPEMLEDLIITAVNNAVKAASDDSDTQLGSITSGLNIPGLF